MQIILSKTLFWRNVFTYPVSQSAIFKETRSIIGIRYNSQKVMLNMQEVAIEYEKSDPRFKCCFYYQNPALNVNRTFQFNRSVDETIEKFLQKIQHAILTLALKKAKRSKKVTVEGINDFFKESAVKDEKIVLLMNNEQLRNDLPCLTFLEKMDPVKLIIYGLEYDVKYNLPRITRIALSSYIMAGFPTYPSIFETKNIKREEYNLKWLIGLTKQHESKWVEIGTGYYVVPLAEHIGYNLKLICEPNNGIHTSPITEIISKGTVLPGPDNCPFEKRQRCTQEKLSQDKFRVVTYNILADMYSDSTYSKDVLFPYCPSYALAMDYRKTLILKELLGFNADIICLQEVDRKIYTRDLDLILSESNFKSVYNTKPGVEEGLAMFYNSKRFTELESNHSVMSENVNTGKFSEVWSQVKSQTTKEIFTQRPTIVQAVTLQSNEDPSKILLVANTHLYFHPTADSIRLLQAYYIITYLEDKITKIKQQDPNATVGVIFCGDFNSSPEDGIYKLLTENHIPSDSPDWNSEKDEIKENISLEQNIRFGSACGTPKYTNYTSKFAGCLDYIFYDKAKFNVTQSVPMPSEKTLKKDIAIPSPVFPSDHISLCADLQWIK